MDRNTILGILLIIAIIIGFSLFNQPNKEEIEQARRRQDSIEIVENAKQKEIAIQQSTANNKTTGLGSVSSDTAAVNNSDSLKKQNEKNIYGSFAAASEGKKEFYTLENDLIKVKFCSKGGRIYSVQLKAYKTFDKKPLILFDGDSTIFGLNFFSQNRSISTNELFFQPTTNDSNIIVSNVQKSLKLRLLTDSGKYIEYAYTLMPNSYKLKFDINFVGVNTLISDNSNDIVFKWEAEIPGLEKGRDFENSYTGIYFKYIDEEVDYLSETSDSDEKNIRTQVKWVAFKQQFFTSVLIADKNFLSAQLKSEKYGENNKYLKNFKAELSLAYDHKQKENIPLSFYFGPTHYNTLKSQGDYNLQKMIPLGWGVFGWINMYAVIPIFNFLDNYITNYGIIILLMTIIIKIVLLPLTYKSYLSTAKMRLLKPQVDEAQAKIPKEKTMERQQASMAIYKKVGVNPLGGCLPMLLQMPILIAMFRFFPASIELRQKGFLWATDLSSYDSILDLPFTIPFYGAHVSLFALLMTISTIIYTKMQNEMSPSTQMPGMKVMMYMMPVMFLFMFNSYSSGLSYYYFLANILTFLQMWLIKKVVNDEKLLQKLQENKKKPVVKSKFQQRLEEMAKQKGYKR